MQILSLNQERKLNAALMLGNNTNWTVCFHSNNTCHLCALLSLVSYLLNNEGYLISKEKEWSPFSIYIYMLYHNEMVS
jgi:hypothetical protein